MLKKAPGPERERLGFKGAVLSNFRFLSDFGLRPVEESATLVRYESSRVFVNVFHGRASYELGVEIGRLEEPEAKLSILDVVRWSRAEKAEGFGKHVMFQVSSRQGVQEFVPKIAALVKKLAIPLLQDDENAYRTALEFRARNYADELNQGNLRILRRRADEAWHSKNYAKVVDLYSEMRSELTEVEWRRLNYAEQHTLTPEGPAHRSPSAGGRLS